MKRALLLVIVAAFALCVAGPVLAAEPVKAPTRLLTPNDAKLPLAELKRLQPPPSLKVQALVKVKPVVVAPTAQGPDLVPIAPVWLNPARPGPAAGFPAAGFPGWRADWRAKNVGNQPAGPPNWKVHFACEVLGYPPGSEAYEHFNSVWCGFSEGTFNIPVALPVGAMTPMGMIKTFVGYPLWPCGCTSCPKPRITFKVDSATNVTETREGNNEYQVDVCTS